MNDMPHSFKNFFSFLECEYNSEYALPGIVEEKITSALIVLLVLSKQEFNYKEQTTLAQ